MNPELTGSTNKLVLPRIPSVSRNPGCFSSIIILLASSSCASTSCSKIVSSLELKVPSSGCVPEPQPTQKPSQKNVTLLSSKTFIFLPALDCQGSEGEWLRIFTLFIMQIMIHKTFLGLCSFIKDSNDLIYFKCWKATLSSVYFSIASMASWLAPAKGMEWQEHFSGITLPLSSLVTLVKHICRGAWCQGFRNSSLPWEVTWLSPGHSSALPWERGAEEALEQTEKKKRFYCFKWRNQSLLMHMKNVRLVLDKYIVVPLFIFLVSVISLIFS